MSEVGLRIEEKTKNMSPVNMNPLVTSNNKGMLCSKLPFTNCAVMAPNRPLIDSHIDDSGRQSHGKGLKLEEMMFARGYIYDSDRQGGHLADNKPIAKVRDEVGKYSTERQSREFQPI